VLTVMFAASFAVTVMELALPAVIGLVKLVTSK
jgi:hypothetical protein